MRRKDMWGNSAAQIFTCISPQMFDLLAVSQELKWLDQYALTYYGCCENLSNKMDSLRKIKNLRKISISCWADPRRAAEEIGRDYVYSFKPSVIMLAAETLDEEDVLRHLREYVSAARAENCATEIILKTVSTVRYKPQNLWKFAQLMRQVAEEG